MNRPHPSGKPSAHAAIGTFERVLPSEATHIQDLRRRAESLARESRPQEAIALWVQLAELYTAQGFLLKALAVCQRVLRHDSDQAEARLALGRIHLLLDAPAEAIRELRELEQRHRRRGRVIDALLVRRRRLDIETCPVEQRLELARALEQAGLGREAQSEFRRAAALMADSEEKRALTARLLDAAPSDPDEPLASEEAVDIPIDFDPGVTTADLVHHSPEHSPAALLRHGSALAALGLTPEAVRLLDRLLQRPDPPRPILALAHLELGRCHEQLGNPVTALAHFHRVLSASPERDDVREWAAGIESRLAEGGRPFRGRGNVRQYIAGTD